MSCIKVRVCLCLCMFVICVHACVYKCVRLRMHL
jgi:hypothetical protein